MARLGSAWAGVSYAGMDQVLHDTVSVPITHPGLFAVLAHSMSRVLQFGLYFL